MKDTRVAAAIFNSAVGKNQENLDRMAVWIAEASKQDAAVICFPELCISGYCNRNDIRRAAETIPGESSRHLQQLAREENLVTPKSMMERTTRPSFIAVKPSLISSSLM